MSKQDRAILLCALLFALGITGYVYKITAGYNHGSAPTVLSIPAASLIGSYAQTRGSSTAPFTLVEFADYQCPACIAMHPQLLQALQQYRNQVKYTFHHFPLPMHPDARPAAFAAEAARKQGRFWQMHDALMTAQGRLSPVDIRSYVRRLG